MVVSGAIASNPLPLHRPTNQNQQPINMKSYAITPTNLAHGYTAPTIYVMADSEKAAIEAAMKISALSKYREWSFGY